MKNRILVIPLALLLALSVVAIGCPVRVVEPPVREVIRIGQVTSLSGPMAGGFRATIGPIYEMWVANINARGGIYVAEYGRRLPIEFIQWDDKSDVGTMTTLLETMLVGKEFDFVLPPWGTVMLYPAAHIFNEHGYILIGGAGGAVKLMEVAADLPYFFQVLNFADTQMPVLADILVELGVKTMAVTHVADLHGIEYTMIAVPEFERRGVEIKMLESYPVGIMDLSPQLMRAKALDVDAFINFSTGQAMLLTRQSMELGINFDVFFISVGPFFPFYVDAFGADGVEGIMSGGAWNPKSSPGAREFYEMFFEFHGVIPDFWGALPYYASLQHFEQAIVKAGTLDQATVRDVVATATFDTFLGPFYYTDGSIFRGHPGQIGQWQGGVFEVIPWGETYRSSHTQACLAMSGQSRYRV